MLLTDPADRDDPARAVGQAAAEVTFGIIDPDRVLSGQSICLFLKTSCRHWGFPEWHR
jgi:hypothetical protein